MQPDELTLPAEEKLTFSDETQGQPAVPVTGNFEQDAKNELTALQLAFRERAKAEEQRRILATDSEYWCCLCFQTREQKDAFLAGLKLKLDSDKYLDGRLLAEKLGIPLPADPQFRDSKIDPSWFDLSLNLD